MSMLLRRAIQQSFRELDVSSYFSSVGYIGSLGSVLINRSIDLLNDGGMVWAKRRDFTTEHGLADTDMGTGSHLSSQNNGAKDVTGGDIQSFETNGYRVSATDGSFNSNNQEFMSLIFKKEEGFFDMQSYSGFGEIGKTVNHNLNIEVGFLVVKVENTNGQWVCWHKDMAITKGLHLDGNDAQANEGWSNFIPTTTQFKVNGQATNNINAEVYRAYLFAHNPKKGIFCGSYTGNGSSTGPIVELGFKPQFILIKAITAVGNWVMLDTHRGLGEGSVDKSIFADTGASEASASQLVDLTDAGFQVKTTNANLNSNTQTYVFMAVAE